MTDYSSFEKARNSLLKAIDQATLEANAIPVAFLIVFAEPGGQDSTLFHYKTSVVGQYFKDKSECFTNALIKGVNQAVIECFEAEPVQDYKVYHA